MFELYIIEVILRPSAECASVYTQEDAISVSAILSQTRQAEHQYEYEIVCRAFDVGCLFYHNSTAQVFF